MRMIEEGKRCLLDGHARSWSFKSPGFDVPKDFSRKRGRDLSRRNPLEPSCYANWADNMHANQKLTKKAFSLWSLEHWSVSIGLAIRLSVRCPGFCEIFCQQKPPSSSRTEGSSKCFRWNDFTAICITDESTRGNWIWREKEREREPKLGLQEIGLVFGKQRDCLNKKLSGVGEEEREEDKQWEL